ncbi:hypothetical protein LINGRAHAP2_LOCUS27781 [Linum grandiflorum]
MMMSGAGSSWAGGRRPNKRTVVELAEYMDPQERACQDAIDQATAAAEAKFLTFTPAERRMQEFLVQGRLLQDMEIVEDSYEVLIQEFLSIMTVTIQAARDSETAITSSEQEAELDAMMVDTYEEIEPEPKDRPYVAPEFQSQGDDLASLLR